MCDKWRNYKKNGVNIKSGVTDESGVTTKTDVTTQIGVNIRSSVIAESDVHNNSGDPVPSKDMQTPPLSEIVRFS